jgi:hypothetical protein
MNSIQLAEDWIEGFSDHDYESLGSIKEDNFLM